MERYCTQCGKVGYPKSFTRGSWVIELVLWVALCFPGLIYSLWRITSRYQGCPSCGAPHMIPLDSPRAEGAVAPPAAGWARELAGTTRTGDAPDPAAVIGLVLIAVILILFAFVSCRSA